MSRIVAARGGIPRFAARVRSGVPATIVAYGTSMTLFGQFLSRLPERLAAATGNSPVRLVNCGFRGFFTFAAAFRVIDAVLPYAPDLVLIEFAHNDAERDALDAIPSALDGIVAQVRAANPSCEFAFVYLAPPGVAAAGPSPAMQAYERVADYYGYPSFDLAAFSEQLVAAGRASWTDAPGPALTSDGIHHTAAAGELLGEPFAAAFIELLRASGGRPQAAPSLRDLALAQTARVPVATQPKTGKWATGTPPNHAVRTAEAYDREVAEPQAPGAAFRVRFEGTRVLVWAMGRGAFETVISGAPARYRVEVGSGPGWSIHTISPPLAPGSYELEAVALELPLVFGDLFVVGRLSAGTGASGVVN